MDQRHAASHLRVRGCAYLRGRGALEQCTGKFGRLRRRTAACGHHSAVAGRSQHPQRRKLSRHRLAACCGKFPNRPPSIALLLPDEVVRVFILSFDTFPRKADEAAPLLRLRLKKSVPFDVEDTTLSWMKQVGRTGNVEVIAALARKEIVREYEQAFESRGSCTRRGSEFFLGQSCRCWNPRGHADGAHERNEPGYGDRSQ